MNTKLFWENVNKRMKYERTQRLQRRRKAGIKRSVEINQMDEEKQLQIECLLQVLEEYVTASLSHPEENYDNERLSEDIDIIVIAVQKLKKDMMEDALLTAGISREEKNASDTPESPGLSLAQKVLDDLGKDSITKKQNDQNAFSPSLDANEKEFEEDKENVTTNLSEAGGEEVLDKDFTVSGSELLSLTNKNKGGNGNEACKVPASTKDVGDSTNRGEDKITSNTPSSVQSPCPPPDYHDITIGTVANTSDATYNSKPRAAQDDLVPNQDEPFKEGQGGGRNNDHEYVEEDSEKTGPVEDTTEESQWNDDIVDLTGKTMEKFSDSTNAAPNTNVVESMSSYGTSQRKSLDTPESDQSKDALRFLKKAKFGINRTKTDKPSIWSRKMTSRSEQQDFSQLEEDMRKEKPKFNLKGDKLLLKAIASLKKNMSQENSDEGPNLEPLPPKLLDAVKNMDPTGT